MPATNPASRVRRRSRVLAWLLILGLTGTAPSLTAQVIVVKPGKLYRFGVSSPATATAGVPFELVIEALDDQGNRIKEAAGIPGAYTVEATGAVALEPRRLEARHFKEGLARVEVTATRAEVLALLLKDPSGGVLGQSDEVPVRHGPLERFVVQAPSVIQAGVAAMVSAEAQDRFGNPVADLSNLGRDLTISADGEGLVEPGAVPLGRFQNGRAAFPIAYRVAETIRLTLSAAGLDVRGTSGPVEVGPGPPDYFQVLSPASVTAGTPFPVTLRAFDAFNNRVTDFARVGADVTLSKTGEGSLTPRSVEAVRFEQGEARVDVSVTRAESFRLSASAQGMVNVSEVIRSNPAVVSQVEIEAPATARVHQPFTLRLTLRDVHGNLVVEPKAGQRAVLLSADGGEVTGGSVRMGSFVNGVASPEVALTAVGSTQLRAKLADKEVGVSGAVDVLAGATTRFTVETPRAIVAGEPFEVVLTALDAHANVVRDYGSQGKQITLRSEGDGPLLLPYPVMPSKFADGRARVTPVVEKTGSMRVGVFGSEGKRLGRSEQLSVQTSRPDHFLVSAPDTAVAGNPFVVRLEARDRFGNLVKDYDRLGLEVRLETDGRGRLQPGIVPAALFKSGVADVEVTYDRAEAFSLSAAIASSADAERGGNGRHSALPVRRPTTAATPAPTRAPDRPPAPRPTPTPSARRTPRAQATPKPTPAPPARTTPTAAPAASPTPRRPRATPTATPSAKLTPASEAGFRITAASYQEEGDRGTLKLAINGLVSARGATELRYGSEWIRITLTPVLNDPAVLLGRVESELFGQVEARLEGRTASIAFELRAGSIDYNVSRRADGVDVTFRRLPR